MILGIQCKVLEYLGVVIEGFKVKILDDLPCTYCSNHHDGFHVVVRKHEIILMQ